MYKFWTLLSFSASQVAPEEEEHKLNWGRYKQSILHLKRRPESPNTVMNLKIHSLWCGILWEKLMFCIMTLWFGMSVKTLLLTNYTWANQKSVQAKCTIFRLDEFGHETRFDLCFVARRSLSMVVERVKFRQKICVRCTTIWVTPNQKSLSGSFQRFIH